MINYLICIGMCTVIWGFSAVVMARSYRKRVYSEIYMQIGLGMFFSMLTLELTLGGIGLWPHFQSFWPRILGFLLFIPSAYLIATSAYALKTKGNPETVSIRTTTVCVRTGIYRIVRQPMTLGTALWSLALMLTFQSSLSVLLGAVAIGCFWMSARTEGTHNIDKLGDDYREYMQKVPMWNVIKGFENAKKEKRQNIDLVQSERT